MESLSKQQILSMIANHQISAEDGMRLYRNASVPNQEKWEQKEEGEEQEAIAIIGMSGRFGEAANVSEYWEKLIEKKSLIRDIPSERENLNACTAEEKAFIQKGGFLDDITTFDPLFFHISPKEAEYMDPRQKLFLEESWKAIEDSGYSVKALSGKKCGVYAGVQQGEYLQRFEGEVGESIPTGNSLSVIPARVSFLLNLKGAAIAVDTACSSSLSAICLACESILNGENDMALAGGIQLMLEPDIYLSLGKLGMLTKEGGCKPFDERADGICLGEGVGVILLKRYSKAKADQDNIYGIIRGFGMNQDGKTNGITAPNGLSQAALIKEVYQKFSIHPEDISYIETHGTGTKLGDPIEIQALSDVYAPYHLPKKSCILSSVKGNIGHTLSASGVASVIKVLLSMKYGKIAATANCEIENSLIAFDKTPFEVAKENKEWKRAGKKRMAAVSSFGMSGTNCHIVIEEEEKEGKETLSSDKQAFLFVLSAKSPAALEQMKQNMVDYLNKEGAEERIEAICKTSLLGRDSFAYRFSCIVRTREELLRALTEEGKLSSTVNAEEVELLAIQKKFMDGIDAGELVQDTVYPKANLPVYPFEKVPCFRSPAKKIEKGMYYIQKNTSSMEGVSYESNIAKEESSFYSKAYYKVRVAGEGTVLGFCCEGGGNAAQQAVRKVKKVRFMKPLVMEEAESITYQLKLNGNNQEMEFFFGQKEGTLLAKGTLDTTSNWNAVKETIHLEECEKCTMHRGKEAFYHILEQQGMDCQEADRWIADMYESLSHNVAILKPIYTHGNAKQMEVFIESAVQVINFLRIQEGDIIASLSEVEQVSWKKNRGILASIRVEKNGQSFTAKGYDQDGELFLEALDMKMQAFCMRHIVSEENYSLMEQCWKEKEIAFCQEKPHGTYLILGNHGMGEKEKEAVKAAFEKIIFLEENVSSFDVSQKEAIAGLIDFSDVSDECEEQFQKAYQKIELLQDLVKQHVTKPFSILHFTKGTAKKDGKQCSMNGISVAGFVRILGAEYSNLLGKTIDLDVPLTDIQAYLAVAYSELASQKEDAEVLYQEKKRYVPQFVCLKNESKWKERVKENQLTVNKDKVYIIAGGTRGIGAETARLLARRGAKKLVILGNTPYPKRESWNNILNDSEAIKGMKEKIQRILELEEYGVEVRVYTGKLTEQEKLSAFIEEIECTLGSIDGVIYCAGSNLNRSPAFINKKIQDIKTVFEPKAEGMQSLHEALKNKRLSFFLAFSSISAALPKMAVGLSDYGSANYYLEHFIRYQYGRGYKHYKALIWPSWLEVGMLVDMNFKLGKAYSSIGINAHGLADGLFMLENVSHVTEHPSMIPAIVNKQMFQTEKPLTGKKQEKEKRTERIEVREKDQNKLRSIIDIIRHFLNEELYIEKEKLTDTVNFADIGVDSIILVEVIKKLEQVLKTEVDASLFLEYPTLQELGAYLCQHTDNVLEEKKEVLEDTERKNELEWETGSRNIAMPEGCEQRQGSGTLQIPQLDRRIAIIGISCRFPGANNYSEFWHNLKNGISSIREVPKDRWDIEKLYSKEYEQGKCTGKWGGYLDDIKSFDAEYFEFKDHAEQISPLMRAFLECTANVIRDAGYEKDEISGKNVGIYVGTHAGSYPSWVTDFYKDTIIGIGQNFIAAYASHFFNLKGPSSTVDSACSSSLLSIHQACQSLWLGETEMAIAGGVDLLLDERQHMVFSASKALSSDGKCHTFDEHANGIVPGEGVGALLLKPYAKAVADGDHIYAVIASSAVNNDGRTMGVTTPSMTGQMEVIRTALERAKINPRAIGYVETHGTGTMIGDPIELKSLTKVYRDYTEDKQFCSVGSVKTNIGHCLSAAGIASFIKTVLCVYHKILVPTLNCDTPNKRFHFEDSPFYLVREAKQWEQEEERMAAVSAFGFGGTNAHVIIKEFNREKEEGYQQKRSSLGEQQFHKKHIWIKEEPKEEPKEEFGAFLDFEEV